MTSFATPATGPRPAAPVPAGPGTSLPRRPPPADPQVVAAVRERLTTGYYVPGARLTMTELHSATGYSADTLRPALDQLATTNLVTGRWRVPDHRPDNHAPVRTRDLLAAMIDHGAYPANTSLPARGELATLLLATPVTLSRALCLLGDEGVLHLSGHARPRVLPSSSAGSSRAAWPPDLAAVQRALPRRRRPGASYDRETLRGIRAAARERWKSGVCLSPDAMAQQEERQAEVLCRLVLTAYDRAAGQPPGMHPRLRSAAARTMACNTLPRNVPLHERQFRFTVLASALADLADSLATGTARHRPRGTA
ncbi:GntR family transcriptional regulator [Streptomyces sp. NPDC051662]|uniref:GntR family transcriptional regulator n=1 Tax=Streptomyces sp. NPDC051662 TaxID=3154750 RepID=UPI00342F922E